MNNELGSRTKGKYPISVGTSVALECFFGVSDDKPLAHGKVPPYLEYQCVLLNVRTLARNYLSSYKAQELPHITFDILFSGLLEEIILINNIINDQSSGKVVVSFYNHSYLKLKNYLKKVTLRQKYTPKQQMTMDMENKLSDAIQAASVTVKQHVAYEYTNDEIRQGKHRNVILTHYPMDLLMTPLRPNLLESHTGRIKKPYEFPSKLKRAGEHMPFNKYTLQLMGDSSGYIVSASSAIRNELMKICKDFGIVPVTQEKRFIKVIKEHASSELRSMLSGM